LQAFIDISGVEELRASSVADKIDLGGGVTLTETMDILTKASAEPMFAYTKEIVKHIDLVANVPVRNIGSLAGNLSIKNQHEEFPSDIFITFEAAGATITLGMNFISS
jgi:xanthine dehydrogenase/oxidase